MPEQRQILTPEIIAARDRSLFERNGLPYDEGDCSRCGNSLPTFGGQQNGERVRAVYCRDCCLTSVISGVPL